MKRFISVIISIALLALAGTAIAEGTVSLVSGGAKQVVLEVTLPDLETSTVSTKGGDFSLLTVPGHGFSTELGKPKLPVISEWVEIPQGAQATASVTMLESKEVSLEELGLKDPIVPVQLPVPKIPGAEEKMVFQKDTAVYSSDAFYGRNGVVLSEPVQLRSKRAMLVSYWPLSYNPATGKVRMITKARIVITLTGSDLARTRSIYGRYASSIYDKYIQSTLLNDLSLAPGAKLVPSAPVNELVIVVDSLYSGILPLTDWDTRKGYHVTITKRSEIPGEADTTHIRQYIQSVYDGANPPDFVLLVGDVNGLPAHRSSEMDLPYTDLYYSTMAGGDYVPDLYVSRISVANTTQLANYVSKYLDYQRSNWGASQDWMEKAYFTSTDDPMHVLTDQTTNYCMALSRSHGMVCDSLFAYYGTGTPVATALNNGRTIMAYTGHGSQTSWAGPSFTQANVNALTNGYMSTFITSFACLTGDFNYGECFGETWIRAAGKGAIAFWGSSVYSYWDEDDILQRRMFDAFLDSGYVWLGGITVKAKLDLGRYYNWNSYNNGGVTVRRYFEMYNLLGSSCVDMYTGQPLAMTVTHPASVPSGPSQVSINVTSSGLPLNQALVAVYRPNTKALLASGYTDPAGNVLLNIDPGAADSLAVTVTAHNHIPYMGQMQAGSGAFVWYLKHAVADPAGNNDGALNPGENAGFTVWLKNFGADSARSVTAKLLSSDPLVTLNDSTQSYGNLAPGESLGLAAFTFSVSGAAPDSHSLGFVVECRDDRDSVWTSGFSETVKAPVLAYQSHGINDPAPGGNDNKALEPGESDSLKVTLANRGGQAALGASAVLSTSDPYLTITGNTASYGDIPTYGSAGSSPAYCLSAGTPPTNPYAAWVRLAINALGGGYTKTDSFQVYIGSPGFSDNVENTTVTSTYTLDGNWHVTGQSYHSAGHSWWCGDSASGGYLDEQNISLTTRDIILGTSSTLSFWHRYSTELDYDYCYLEYSTDGGSSWNNLATFNGYQTSWTQASYDLSFLGGGTLVKIRFRFYSDYSVNDLGWYVDDIVVQGATGVGGGQNQTPPSLMLGLAYPNPSAGRLNIGYQLPKPALVEFKVYNIQGQLVRMLAPENKPAGSHTVTWDGCDQAGRAVSAGVYLYRLSALGQTRTGKLAIIR